MYPSNSAEQKCFLTSPNWYAVYTRSRCEKKVAFLLNKNGVEYFLPLIPKNRKWKDRNKVVNFPMFPGYLFVCINLKDRFDVLMTDGVVRLVGFNGKPSPVPATQIESLRQLLIKPEFIEPSVYIRQGEPVEIIYGPFTGVRGRLLRYNGRRRVVISVDLIQQSVSIDVDQNWVQPLQTKLVHN